MGSAHLGMGRYAQAIAWFKKYLELVPTSAYAHHWIAVCHLQRGAGEDALREAEAVLAIDPRFTDARVMKGAILAARGDHAGAIAELRAAVAADPAKPMIRRGPGQGAGRGRPAGGRARPSTRRPCASTADYVPALAGLGALQAAQGEHQAAQGTLPAPWSWTRRRRSPLQPGPRPGARRRRARPPEPSTKRWPDHPVHPKSKPRRGPPSPAFRSKPSSNGCWAHKGGCPKGQPRRERRPSLQAVQLSPNVTARKTPICSRVTGRGRAVVAAAAAGHDAAAGQLLDPAAERAGRRDVREQVGGTQAGGLSAGSSVRSTKTAICSRVTGLDGQ